MYSLRGNESDPTKAGWFWKVLYTEREFSAAYLNAVLADDSKAIASALELIGKFPEDVELRQDEFMAFTHGVTPAGELELSSWGGYYVTDPISDGRVFALLISSYDNRVFWGPEEGFADKYWSECAVDYHFGPNATLCFSSDGDVTLSFSRVVGLSEDDLKFSDVRVKGTIGTAAISAVPTAPLLPKSKDRDIAGGRPIVDEQTLSFGAGGLAPVDPDENQSFVLSDGWKTYTAYAGIYKEPALVLGVVLWLCPPLRRVCYKYLWELRRVVGTGIEHCLQWKKGHISGTYVDLGDAMEKVVSDITTELNEKLRDADFGTKSLDQILRERQLYDAASTQMEKSLKEYIKERLQAIANQDVADMPSDLAKRMEKEVPNWVKNDVDERSGAVMEHFDSVSPGINSIVEKIGMETRNQFYHDHAESLATKIDAIDSFVKETRATITSQTEQMEDWKKKAQELREQGKTAQADLAEHEATKLDFEIKRKQKEITEKEAERDKADKDRRDAEGESKRYTPEQIEEHEREWEKEVKKHIKA
ncbi:hypothetical protein H0H92_014395 [Tricholoma furcatifolium]|nr:hypothetical protein H0H92_014395 [Tricholoma furcatifolium]